MKPLYLLPQDREGLHDFKKYLDKLMENPPQTHERLSEN